MKKAQMKKIIFITVIVMLCSVFSMVSYANTDTGTDTDTGTGTTVTYATPREPELETYTTTEGGIIKCFFANGTPITIEAKPGSTGGEDTGVAGDNTTATVSDGAIIRYTYEGETKTIEVDKYTNVFGGAHESDEIFETSNITMNGGSVYNILGGGLHKSHVAKANVTMNGGTVVSFSGGGSASFIKYCGHDWFEDRGYDDALKNYHDSVTRVDEATVIVNGGTITSTLYAGGEGLDYVGKANTVIENGTIYYVSSSGSNGHMGESTMKINGGNITVLQSINRGKMITSNIEVTGGNIQTAYVGGETEDPKVNGIVEKATLTISGGTVTNLKMGTSNANEITDTNEIATVLYGEGLVTNVDESITNATESTKLLDKIMVDGEVKYINPNSTLSDAATEYVIGNLLNPGAPSVDIITEKPIIISEEILEAAQDSGKILTVTVGTAGKIRYTWNLSYSDITNPTIEIQSTEITLTDTPPSRVFELEDHVTNFENVRYLNFMHHGTLPGKVKIQYSVGTEYEDGTIVFIRHYNETSGILGAPVRLTVENGMIEFETSSCSTFVLSTTGDGSGDTDPDNPTVNDTVNDPNVNDTVDNPNVNDTVDNPNVNDTVDNPNVNDTVDNPNVNDTVDNPNVNDTTNDPSVNPNPGINDVVDTPDVNDVVDNINDTQTGINDVAGGTGSTGTGGTNADVSNPKTGDGIFIVIALLVIVIIGDVAYHVKFKKDK